MCAGCVSRREKICWAGRGGSGRAGRGGAGLGGAERETGYHAEILEKRNLATVNHLLSSESKSNGFPIEFEIVSQNKVKKVRKISWYPNQ